jgi:hypothetical protein
MVARMRASLTAARVTALLVALALLAGCGTGAKAGTPARASAAVAEGSCQQAVLTSLAAVLKRVYGEGIHSERTAAAEHMIQRSLPLRTAVEEGNPRAARAAVRTLLKTGHMTDLQVTAGGRLLASVGPAALAPVHGTLKGASGSTIATYVYSVWEDRGFVAESTGVAEGLIALRQGDRSVGGSATLPAGALPPEGALNMHGVSYQYTTFPANAYPTGAPVTVYLLKTSRTIDPLCGPTGEDTIVNTVSGVARLIYQAEGGARTLPQVRRIQRDVPLLRAVAAQDPAATKKAIVTLLHHHVVRLRVSGRGGLLSDVGGPYVLAPVAAPLSLGGKRIGSVVLSIQDDEGYLRLTRRLAGLSVLMYMANANPSLVKNSLGPGVGGLESVPASGRFVYRGRTFRVFTIDAKAFPSGSLTIRVLIPIPYS